MVWGINSSEIVRSDLAGIELATSKKERRERRGLVVGMMK
jgi:hypothetical protein